MTVEIRDQASKEIRVREIEARLSKLTARKNKLMLSMTGFNNSVVPELNEVCAEYARLDLEKYELERG